MGQKSIIIAIGLIIFTIILAVLFAVGRLRPDSTPKKDIAETTNQAPSRNVVSVIDIVNEPMVYDEYSLEVDSDIISWTTNRSFLFGARSGGGLIGGTTRTLLAISDKPFQLPQTPNDGKLGLGENANVTAKGRIEIMNRDQLEVALGVDFDSPENGLYSNAISNWSLGPVLIISELKVNEPTR